MATNYQSMVESMLNINGSLGAAVVDYESGMLLASGANKQTVLDLEIAAAGITDVISSNLKTMKMLSLNDVIEDILITLGKQYHLLRPLSKHDGLFLYCVLDRNHSNLALARRGLHDLDK